jgi:hypothetical protein
MPRKQVEKVPEPKRKVGRPTSYRPEYAELAYKFCLLGASDERLAEMFDVVVSTIYEWKLAVPEFSEALTRGKEVADAEVAHALFHRAKGYSHMEDDIRTVALPSGGGSEIVITPTVKHYPPDTGAATLWLKNRQPKVWRDKVETELSGTLHHQLYDTAQATRMAEMMLKAKKAK